MKTALNLTRLVCVMAGSLAGTMVFGQVPDAGSLRQQIEREREVQLPRKLAPTAPAEPPALKALTGQTVTVTTFRFAGNTLLGAGQLAGVVSGYINRPIDFSQLQAAATAVASAYREAGWTVRTYLPQQDIVGGVVTIQIVEAVFGGVQLEGAPATRVGLAQIQRGFDAMQAVGAPLNADALDRALLLADDLPGVAVSGGLREGAQAGQTNLAIQLADEPLAMGDAAIDNIGSRSTGANRVSANLNFNSPLKLGDLISANLIHAEGSDYLRLGGSLPVGDKGWRIGATAAHFGYRLVSPEFTALSATGSSSTVGLEASYPLIRSRLRNLYLTLNYDSTSFDNQSGGVSTTNYKVGDFALALNGNLYDNWLGGGANTARLSYVAGTVNLDGSPNQAADSATTQTDGHFSKLRWNMSRQQVLASNLAVFAQYSRQTASKNLDSSEKFYLGGAGGVRAYPANEGGGSQGQMFNLELRWRLPQGLNLTGFYDWGKVTVNQSNDFAGATAVNDYSLKGAGLALAWQGSSGLSLRATLARRMGDNPNPTLTGTDQDGSLVSNRLWLNASLPF